MKTKKEIPKCLDAQVSTFSKLKNDVWTVLNVRTSVRSKSISRH